MWVHPSPPDPASHCTHRLSQCYFHFTAYNYPKSLTFFYLLLKGKFIEILLSNFLFTYLPPDLYFYHQSEFYFPWVSWQMFFPSLGKDITFFRIVYSIYRKIIPLFQIPDHLLKITWTDNRKLGNLYDVVFMPEWNADHTDGGSYRSKIS